eukprot:COSAG06_NODE_43553_length_371_cov_0.573529_2_plen_33_part_01
MRDQPKNVATFENLQLVDARLQMQSGAPEAGPV